MIIFYFFIDRFDVVINFVIIDSVVKNSFMYSFFVYMCNIFF